MPVAPKRFSLFTAKPRKPWSNGSRRTFTGRALQREREALFSEQPLCVECLKNGRLSIATIRDHIIPLAFGGKDERSNTQSLCEACSDSKTKGESAQGRKLSRGG